jgi:hypothetical protein
MMQSPTPRVRLGLAAACFSLAACTGTTDFTITESFIANSAGSPAVYSDVQAVDLASDAPDAWKHRDKVDSLELVGLDATMTASPSPGATTGSGTLSLRPDGGTGSTDVVVGTWPSEPIPASAPHSIGVTLSPAAVSVIESALTGSGKFSIVMTGATAAPVIFPADVSLHLKLKYKLLF